MYIRKAAAAAASVWLAAAATFFTAPMCLPVQAANASSETEKTPEVITDKEIIKTVQEALNKAGYDCGTPDGISGKKTAAAIEEYQKAKNLKVTSVIDNDLLISLGLKADPSKAAAENPKFSKLYDYISETGDLLENGGHVLVLKDRHRVTYLHAFEDAASFEKRLVLYTASRENSGGMAEFFYDLAVELSADPSEAPFTATASSEVRMNGTASSVESVSRGVLVPAECTADTSPEVTDFLKTTVRSDGTVSHSKALSENDTQTYIDLCYSHLLEDIPVLLSGTKQRVTLADLGFTQLS